MIGSVSGSQSTVVRRWRQQPHFTPCRHVALPAYMISNLMGGYDRPKLLSMLPGLPVPFAVMIASYLVAIGVAAVLRVRKDRRGAFNRCFRFEFGVHWPAGQSAPFRRCEPALRASVLHREHDAVLDDRRVWNRGGWCRPKRDPETVACLGLGPQAHSLAAPPGFLTAVILILLGIKLPKSIMDTCKYLGNMTTPCPCCSSAS